MTSERPTAFLDCALIWDAQARRADCALGDDGDLVLDETPVTAMLIALGADRRAEADDELPDGVDALNAQTSFVTRRGWSGDALDALSRRIGSRLWLLNRAKQTETTRRFAEIWATEALAFADRELGRPAIVEASWLRRGVLALRCLVDGAELVVPVRTAG